MHAVWIEVQIVDEEDDRAATNGWVAVRRSCGQRVRVNTPGQLFLPRTAGRDALEKSNGPRLAINQQFKLPTIETLDEVATFIHHGNPSLHQVGIDAQDFGSLRF